MGGFTSAHMHNASVPLSLDHIIKVMLPVYYDDSPITDEEYHLALNSWDLILQDKISSFQTLKEDPKFIYSNSKMYFCDLYYKRLFDIHPLAKDLFTRHSTKGDLLIRMISVAFHERTNPHEHKFALEKIAQIHNTKGVKSIECKYSLSF